MDVKVQKLFVKTIFDEGRLEELDINEVASNFFLPVNTVIQIFSRTHSSSSATLFVDHVMLCLNHLFIDGVIPGSNKINVTKKREGRSNILGVQSNGR